jgi:sulfhydrogenase subunit beta (sulfur reductase)
MTLKMMPKPAISPWVKALSVDHQLIGPRPRAGQIAFDPFSAIDEIDLGYQQSALPPKKWLTPTHERIFHFQGNGAGLAPYVADGRMILFGVHTCDLHAIAILDRAFGWGYPDQHYLARRERAIIVSIECLRPCSEHSFCKDMGALTVPESFDLHLTDLGGSYAVETGSEQGDALLRRCALIRDASKEELGRLGVVMSEKWARFPHRLDFDLAELPSLLTVSRESPLWEEIGDKCLGCGACTVVCPTCYCFNMVDEVNFSLETGDRCRVWDSCQLDGFASVAGGHDFRANRADRVQHRFFRKGKYLSEAFGRAGCVGCGRCAQACLVQITPLRIFNDLYHQREHASRRETEVLT